MLAAFSDWLSVQEGPVGQKRFSEEEIKAQIAAIQKFTEFIEPKLLAKCTVADLGAFSKQNTLNTEKSIKARFNKARFNTFSAVISFRDFRKVVIKKQPMEKLVDTRFLVRRYHIIDSYPHIEKKHEKIRPDREDAERVDREDVEWAEREHPNEPDGQKYLLAQAHKFLRLRDHHVEKKGGN